jgi:hypothetical protein
MIPRVNLAPHTSIGSGGSGRDVAGERRRRARGGASTSAQNSGDAKAEPGNVRVIELEHALGKVLG